MKMISRIVVCQLILAETALASMYLGISAYVSISQRSNATIAMYHCSALPAAMCREDVRYNYTTNFRWEASSDQSYDCSCWTQANWTQNERTLAGSTLSYHFKGEWTGNEWISCQAVWPAFLPVTSVLVLVDGYGYPTSDGEVVPMLDDCSISFGFNRMLPIGRSFNQTFNQTIVFHSKYTAMSDLGKVLTGMIVGIVVGAVLCVVCIVVAIVCCCRCCRRRARGNNGTYVVLRE
eukprot:TRINITY_DN23164_c0_g1_i1.p1 TRINITY_DN23164_c0_g1~~TRINITY_DN23164_c0_g1_i1.p1  ORF type:complete len:235 (-),score=18.03 TRINITY_DN23164_c0_g1_i1:55-759(-)